MQITHKMKRKNPVEKSLKDKKRKQKSFYALTLLTNSNIQPAIKTKPNINKQFALTINTNFQVNKNFQKSTYTYHNIHKVVVILSPSKDVTFL
jgi:hypothetical protein